jgi:mRNA interferase MazF
MVAPYMSEQGDIIFLEFDPGAGHEQKGRRPAIVVSNNTFNRFTNLALVCPITNTARGFPLHITLDNRTKTTGVIMCEQVKSLDILARKATFVENAPRDILDEAVDILFGLLETEQE